MLTLIVARGRNGEIGRAGGIPWHIPEDLKSFKRETLGGALIMGRKTWESLPVKPLPSRFNCVLSRSGYIADQADTTCSSIDEALEECRAAGYTRTYGIGGTHSFSLLLPRAHRLLITEVDISVPDADTFFPEIDQADWYESGSITLQGEGPHSVIRELLTMNRYI